MKVLQFTPWVGDEEYKAIAESFKTNWITEGPKANEFRVRLLELMGVKFGVFAPNGTLALYLALKSLDIGPGDEVIVPDLTFIASANSVEMVGATPIFIDVDPKTLQIDVSKIEALVSKKTRAIMPVHLFGSMGDMDGLIKLASRYKLLVVEDAAQAIGVRYKGRHAGTFGNTGAFSFFADKTVTTAEGGFVLARDEKVYKKLLFLRNQGRLDRGTFIHPEIGYNFRMTDIQCAMGLVQLNKLKEIIKRKIAIAAIYRKLLTGIKEVSFLEYDHNSEWIPFRVGILCKDAHKLMEFMNSRQIQPRSFFYPLHKQPCYKYLKKIPKLAKLLRDKNFPAAVYAYDHGVCLPTSPTLSQEEINYVCAAIKEFYGYA